MKLDKTIFGKFLKQAKYQFLLKDGKNIYFIPVPNCISFSDNHFVAHNETTRTVEIVNYTDIKSCTIDGKEIQCNE